MQISKPQPWLLILYFLSSFFYGFFNYLLRNSLSSERIFILNCCTSCLYLFTSGVIWFTPTLAVSSIYVKPIPILYCLPWLNGRNHMENAFILYCHFLIIGLLHFFNTWKICYSFLTTFSNHKLLLSTNTYYSFLPSWLISISDSYFSKSIIPTDSISTVKPLQTP